MAFVWTWEGFPRKREQRTKTRRKKRYSFFFMSFPKRWTVYKAHRAIGGKGLMIFMSFDDSSAPHRICGWYNLGLNRRRGQKAIVSHAYARGLYAMAAVHPCQYFQFLLWQISSPQSMITFVVTCWSHLPLEAKHKIHLPRFPDGISFHQLKRSVLQRYHHNIN